MVALIINFIKITAIDSKLGPGIRPAPEDAIKAVSSIPNILLAFLYQMNFFPIYKGLKDSTDKKMLNSSMVATVCCFLVYGTTGILGYFTYGENLNSNSNFLTNLQRENTGLPLYIIMNLVFLISVLCSFPLIFFGARNNFIALFKVFKGSKQESRDNLRHGDSIADIS